MCIDWTDELEISGDRGEQSFKSLDFKFLPCNFNNEQNIPGSSETVNDDCITDQQKQIDYLGNTEAQILYTYEVFDVKKFGSESIKRVSQLVTT